MDTCSMGEDENRQPVGEDEDGIRAMPMHGVAKPFVNSQPSPLPRSPLPRPPLPRPPLPGVFSSEEDGGDKNRLFEKEVGRLRELVEMMEPSFTLHALEPGRLLNGRADDMNEAMHSASWVSLMFTSQPVTAALSKWQAKLFLILLGAFFSGIGCLYFFQHENFQVAQIRSPTTMSQSFRFTAVELRDRTRRPDLASPGIKSFGLAIYGVPLEDRLTENMTTFSDGPDLYLTFPSPVEFNGWFITTSDDDPSKDAVVYELRCLRGKRQDVARVDDKLEQQDWVVVGRSGWYYSGGAVIQASSTMEYRNENLPLCRRCREIYDYSVRPLGFLVKVGSWFGMGLCCLAGSIAAMMNRQRTGRFLVGCGFGFMAFSNCVASGSSLAVGRVDGAIGPMMLSADFTVWFFVFCYLEQYTLQCLLINGIWVFLFGIISSFITGFNLNLGPLFVLAVLPVLPLTSGASLFIYYKRWELKHKTWQLVKPDLDRYDEIWAKFLRSDDAANVEKLEELCRAVANRTDDFRGERYARQLNRCRASAEDKSLMVIEEAPWMMPDDSRRSMMEPAQLNGLGGGMRFSRAMSSESRHPDIFTSGSPGVMPRAETAASARGLVQGGDVQRHKGRRRSAARKSRNTVTPEADISMASSFDSHDACAVGSARESTIGSAIWGEAVSSDWLENYKPSHILGPEYLSYTTLVGTVDETNPVKSLDQLYLQASGVSPQLREHVLKWSEGSNALLPFMRPSPDGTRLINTFESHASATRGLVSFSPGGANRGGVKWAKLKNPERASEKAMRSYGGDLSQLLDICRQQIVFSSMGDLVQCLGQIADDGGVRVVRVKNRMSRGYDGNSSMGYRDVQVNLRFSNEHVMQYGLETHVCEVQLVLLEYAKVKTEEGHARYVEFRNRMGE